MNRLIPTRNYTICVILMLFSINCYAQLPNAGFENWNTVGSPSYFDPQGWGTLNSASGILGIYTAQKDTAVADVHGGTSSIKLSTHFIAGVNQTAPGLITTGSIDATSHTISGGFPYTERPPSLSGWYKYIPGTRDSFYVSVVFFKHNNSTGKLDTIAKGDFWGGDTTTTFTKFTVNVHYLVAEMPDTGRVTISSSRIDSAKDGTLLFIDDLSFVACNGLHVTTTGTAPSSITDSNGTATATFSGGTPPLVGIWSTHDTALNINNLHAGSYCYNVSDSLNCSAADCRDYTFTTGIASVGTEKINVYPNPASDILVIDNAAASTELTIYNTNGQLLHKQTIGTEKATVDIKSLAPGFYIYNVREIISGNVMNGKLLIVR